MLSGLLRGFLRVKIDQCAGIQSKNVDVKTLGLSQSFCRFIVNTLGFSQGFFLLKAQGFHWDFCKNPGIFTGLLLKPQGSQGF